jgi:acyl carrier protein
MDEKTIKAEVRTVLAEYAQLSVDAHALSDDTDLFTSGMSSLKSVNVMLALEDRFDVEFPNDMLTRATFETVNAMAKAIASLNSAYA